MSPGASRNSVRSWPTQNPRPAPVITTARTSAARASLRAAPSARCMSALNALRTSGRLSVIFRTAPSRVVSTSAIPEEPRRLAAVACVRAEQGPGTAEPRRARAHEREPPVPGWAHHGLDPAAAEPLGEGLVLGVVLAVVGRPNRCRRIVAVVREPHADDRVAGLEQVGAAVLRRRRRLPWLNHVVHERVVEELGELVAEVVDVGDA